VVSCSYKIIGGITLPKAVVNIRYIIGKGKNEITRQHLQQ